MAEAAKKQDSRDPVQAQRWKDAIQALSKEDHYINAMLAGFSIVDGVVRQQHRVRDMILYVAIAVSIVIAITIYAMYTSH